MLCVKVLCPRNNLKTKHTKTYKPLSLNVRIKEKMKIKPYLDKLTASSQYKEFQQKYKDAFLVAGFFVLDFETGQRLHQIDYYLPKEKKFAAFTLDDKVIFQLLRSFDKKMPEKLDINTKIELDTLKGIVEDEMHNRSITQEIKKMIAVVQTIKGKKIWNVNCVLSGMDILRAHVEDESKTILKMEKNSMMDYVKHMPPMAAAAQPDKAQEPGSEDAEKKLEQLDKLKEAIKQQQAELEKKASAKKSK